MYLEIYSNNNNNTYQTIISHFHSLTVLADFSVWEASPLNNGKFEDPNPVKEANGEVATVVSDVVPVVAPNTGFWKENPGAPPLRPSNAAADTVGAGIWGWAPKVKLIGTEPLWDAEASLRLVVPLLWEGRTPVDADTDGEPKGNFPSSFCPHVSTAVTLSGDFEAAIRLPNSGKGEPTARSTNVSKTNFSWCKNDKQEAHRPQSHRNSCIFPPKTLHTNIDPCQASQSVNTHGFKLKSPPYINSTILYYNLVVLKKIIKEFSSIKHWIPVMALILKPGVIVSTNMIPDF